MGITIGASFFHFFRVFDGTNEVRILTSVMGDNAANDDSRDAAADESFPRLFG